MTRKLSELFDLPVDTASDNEGPLEKAQVDEISKEAYSNLEKIDQALPSVRGLDATDTEMDDLASKATESFSDLMALGMQVDSRFSAEIFNSASTFLGHAITAKTAKITKKLKMLDLQLKKAALDHKISATVEEVESTTLGSGQSLDRNELLKILNQQSNAK